MPQNVLKAAAAVIYLPPVLICGTLSCPALGGRENGRTFRDTLCAAGPHTRLRAHPFTLVMPSALVHPHCLGHVRNAILGPPRPTASETRGRPGSRCPASPPGSEARSRSWSPLSMPSAWLCGESARPEQFVMPETHCAHSRASYEEKEH